MKAKSQSIGKEFEDKVKATLDTYMAHQLGFFWRNYQSSRVVYIRGRPKTVRVKGLPDFAGVLIGGRYIVFDTKSTNNKNKWTLSKGDAHQYEHMLNASKFGAMAFFLLEMRPAGVCVILRVSESCSYPDNRPTVSLAVADEDAYVATFEPVGNYIDWLSTLQENAGNPLFRI